MTMLDRMRRHKGYLKWFLALVAVALSLYLIPGFLDRPTGAVGASSKEVIAEVDGHDLTAGEFQSRYQQQVQAYRAQFGGNINESLLRQLGVDQTVLRQMVDEQVAVLEAERQGVRVTDDELAEQIVALPAFQENGQFIGDDQYRAILRAQNPPLTVSEFEESMRRSLLLDKLRGALTDWMSVSDEEVEREYKLRNEKVKVQVVALTADKFRDKVTVSDADVASYYDAHKAEYRVGEQRRIKFLLLDREQARTRVQVTPGEIQREYNDNIQQYETPEQIRASHILFKTEGKNEAEVRARAEEVLKQVKSGGDFAALARKYSEDEGSKDKGGDLDYFSKGRMVPEFETAAFALQPGQTSELVRSQFGFHIIKVIDKKPETTRPLDQVRSEIQERLLAQKVNDQLQERAEQLAQRIDSPDDLDRVAGEAGATVQQSDFFTRDGMVTNLGVAPQVTDSAFRLADNQVSGALSTPRGPVFITVTGKKEPYVPKLDEVKDRVREDVTRARATELSRQRAREIAEALKTAKDFAAAAKAQGLEAKETALVSRGAALPDIGVSPELDKIAFALPVGGVSAPIPTNDATAIVRVAERDEVTPDEFRKAREAFRADLLNERRERFFNAYMTKLRENATINVKTDVLRRVMAARGL
jgi:peptidyl-prolyl cis-trans isomerase D